MKAISLTQPWATLVAIGAKRLETRSWQTPHRGPIAIHAAKNIPADIRRILLTDAAFRRHVDEAFAPHGLTLKTIPYGAIVAIAKLTTCVQAPAAIQPKPGTPEYAFGDYTRGRWIWVLEDIRPFMEAIPATGALGVWDWMSPAELEEAAQDYGSDHP